MTNVPPAVDRILPLILVANTAIFYVAARLYLFPLIARRKVATKTAVSGGKGGMNTKKVIRDKGEVTRKQKIAATDEKVTSDSAV
jgi:hypothetical protein